VRERVSIRDAVSIMESLGVHLVLPAAMKRADLARTIDRYSIFRPAKLLFTRRDDTATYGALVNEAARRSLPLSFFATGQQIADDLEPATRERLAALVRGAPLSAPVIGRGATA